VSSTPDNVDAGGAGTVGAGAGVILLGDMAGVAAGDDGNLAGGGVRWGDAGGVCILICWYVCSLYHVCLSVSP
jgi:hypothetical protein